ncbi:MAG: hypothetical protein O9294_17170 [Cytophagales bacterium]|nr:hypothetical protein [Cytophagales bacterium]
MAIHLLNLSIDSKDLLPTYLPENLAINDIESFTELIAENILGFENSFIEHEETDDTSEISTDNNSLFNVYYNRIAILLISNWINTKIKFSFLSEKVHIGYLSLDSPPPKY